MLTVVGYDLAIQDGRLTGILADKSPINVALYADPNNVRLTAPVPEPSATLLFAVGLLVSGSSLRSWGPTRNRLANARPMADWTR